MLDDKYFFFKGNTLCFFLPGDAKQSLQYRTYFLCYNRHSQFLTKEPSRISTEKRNTLTADHISGLRHDYSIL